MSQEYLRFRGKVLVADALTTKDLDMAADTNVASPLRWIGNAVEFDLKLSSERFKHQESWSGQDLTDVSQIDSLGASMSVMMQSLQKENIGLALFSQPFLSDSGSVTGAYLGRLNVAGKWVFNKTVLPALNTWLPILKKQYPNVQKYTYIASTTLVITDSTPTTPKTLAIDVNYVLHPDFMTNGLIKFIDLSTGGAFVGPLKCAFSVGSMTDVLPQPIGFGLPYALTHPNVSDLLIKDSAGTPVTVDAAYYSLEAPFGELEFLAAQEAAFEAENYVEPIKAIYTYAPSTHMPILSEQPKNQWIRLRGVNKLNDRKVIIDIYNVSLDPADSLKLLVKDLTTAPLRGEMVADPSKPVDSVMGRFGRVIYVD